MIVSERKNLADNDIKLSLDGFYNYLRFFSFNLLAFWNEAFESWEGSFNRRTGYRFSKSYAAIGHSHQPNVRQL